MSKKILVADDEEDQESLFKQKFLKKEFLRGCEFIFVRNGKEALKKINDFSDIVIALLDINMPGMDGLSILGKAKTINPRLNIILISAYDDPTNIQVGAETEAIEFISKPIDFELLEKALKAALLQSSAP